MHNRQKFIPSAYCTDVLTKSISNGRRPRKNFHIHGMGQVVLMLVIVGLLTAGATTIQAMVTDVETTKNAAKEAARPADIQIVRVTAQDCPNCYSTDTLTDSLGKAKQVNVKDTRAVDYATTEGRELVQRYGLARVPAFIVQGEIDKLLTVLPQLQAYGTKSDNAFVGVKLPGAYREISSGNVRGEFDITYITEKKCPECYDPTVNRQALAQVGLFPKNEKTVDRSDAEGLELVKKYSLTTTPTILLTGDIKVYAGFDTIWKNVGTIESDGTYVFRSGQELMGTYYDLSTGKAVTPKQTESNTNQ